MKYYIFDNDNGVMVCATESRKEAFSAVLNHLINSKDSEVPDPIMWPVVSTLKPDEQVPATAPLHDAAWYVIRDAQAAYKLITGLVPIA